MANSATESKQTDLCTRRHWSVGRLEEVLVHERQNAVRRSSGVSVLPLVRGQFLFALYLYFSFHANDEETNCAVLHCLSTVDVTICTDTSVGS